MLTVDKVWQSENGARQKAANGMSHQQHRARFLWGERCIVSSLQVCFLFLFFLFFSHAK